MQITHFKSVVIKNGQVLGHIVGKMTIVNDISSKIFDIELQALNAGVHLQITDIDQAKLQTVTGWGEITHIYKLDDDN